MPRMFKSVDAGVGGMKQKKIIKPGAPMRAVAPPRIAPPMGGKRLPLRKGIVKALGNRGGY